MPTKPNTVTHTYTQPGLTTNVFAKLKTLLGASRAGKTDEYEDVHIENVGDVTIYVASMPDSTSTPTDKDMVQILVNKTEYLGKINTNCCYILSSFSGGESPAFKIIAEPAQN